VFVPLADGRLLQVGVPLDGVDALVEVGLVLGRAPELSSQELASLLETVQSAVNCFFSEHKPFVDLDQGVVAASLDLVDLLQVLLGGDPGLFYQPLGVLLLEFKFVELMVEGMPVELGI
jgi:hypothetical protein